MKDNKRYTTITRIIRQKGKTLRQTVKVEMRSNDVNSSKILGDRFWRRLFER